jgi:hypothetical protein
MTRRYRTQAGPVVVRRIDDPEPIEQPPAPDEVRSTNASRLAAQQGASFKTGADRRGRKRSR